MRLSAGVRLGPYEILGLLGRGGMGEVYRARDTRLDRDVALKVLPADVAADSDRLARFEREARTVASLNHPNIIVLHSIEEHDGVRFLTMELVEGQSLDHLVVPGGLAIDHVLDMGIALADALAAAHARGVIHRDLKPGNVLVSPEGRVKVLDFGLAKLTGAEMQHAVSQAATITTPTSPTHIVGTAPYMSPEQIRGAAVDARSDLFALGILLYELVTGRRPFAGDSAADVTSSILRDDPPPILSLRGNVPADLSRIVGRCLEKDPARRLQTAKDVRNELELARRAMASSSRSRSGEPPPAAALEGDRRSVAVMPFENRGRDEDDEYFADGITEDVIAQLCKVRTIKVISRNSVMPFKRHTQSLRDIAATLQVAHVLEGSVRRAGDRVRIVAQLVEPISGQTLWAETYDRRLTDIFEIQTEVALHIAGALRAELSPRERERIQREPIRDLQAYELTLRGRQCLLRYTVEEGRRGVEYFEKALARDPELVSAHVGLALALAHLAEQGVAHGHDAERALEAADRAVTLDPELGDAHSARAFARLVFETDFAGAEEGFRRALALSPGSVFAYDLYGRMCAGLGRFDEALVLQEKAQELDPLTQRIDLATSLIRAGRDEDAVGVATRAMEVEPHDGRIRATLGWALFRQGRKAEGLRELELAVQLTPDEDMWLAQLGQAYGLSGQPDKAREVLRKLEDPSRPTPVSPYHQAYVHVGLGEMERALDCLEAAHERGGGPLYGLPGSFLMAPLREHPRFIALLGRLQKG